MAQSLNPGRLAAARALLAVEEGKHVDSVLLGDHKLSAMDAGLARHLALGVLRRRGELDQLINKLARGKLDRGTRTVLRIGLFELNFSRTPGHAAVDQAVQLIRALGKGRASGLVNAVLRKAQGRELSGDATLNHPRWLVDRWQERYGEQPVADWCARMDAAAPLTVCTQDGQPPQGWPGELEPATSGGERVPGCYWVRGIEGAVSALPDYEAGTWWVMDPAAAATADLLQVQPGERVLDACAAPGGKTFRMLAQGATVTSTDRSQVRLQRLEESLERLNMQAQEVRKVDWRKRPWMPEQQFDAALVDAPCTGLGTTRRHPEIRWSRQSSDPVAMSLIQLEILGNVAGTIRPGGRVVYAVCSPEPEEGRAVVDAFLASHPDWTLDVELRTAPPAADEDAFYAARIQRAPEGA